jgi:uncharacterized protein YndB with AHSA1/START domain
VFREIVKPERIVYAHGGKRKDGPGVHFLATWTFEALGKQTRLTLHQLFDTPEDRDTVIREYGAIEGGKQTLARLAGYLPQMTAFVITRTFDAPRELVWKAWTEEEHLQRWFGPKGCTIRVARMELRPGGICHYCMTTPDGKEMWGKWTYREIVAPEQLVLVSSFSDAQGGITRHPMSSNWPLETISTTTFEEHAGKTTITIHWSPQNATELETSTFDGAHESMKMGWGGTFEQLENYLATLPNR